MKKPATVGDLLLALRSFSVGYLNKNVPERTSGITLSLQPMFYSKDTLAWGIYGAGLIASGRASHTGTILSLTPNKSASYAIMEKAMPILERFTPTND